MALPTELLIAAVGTLVAAIFIHLAATFSLGGTHFGRALLVAVVGNVVGVLVWLVFRDFSIFGYVIVLIAWLAICATVYRTSIWRALFIGLFSYLLWVLTRNLVGSIAELVR